MRNASKVFRTITRGLFLPACLLLALQAATSRVLSVPERQIPLPGLRQAPLGLGNWQARGEQTLEPTVSEYLQPDEYIVRNYANQATGGEISVFVAFFKSLQNVYGPHSPRVCLPGSGWLVRSSKIGAVQVPGRAEAIPVNEYILEKSDTRILMLYWYQNNRNVWAEEFQAKLTLLPDLIRFRRSDASLVRLIAPMRSTDGSKELADTREFTKLLYPMLAERFRTTD